MKVTFRNQTARIVLEQEDFEALARGREIIQNRVSIILTDIGYGPMTDILQKAIRDSRP